MGLSATDFARIRLLGHPVLCVDTCSVLDIMRDATRPETDLNSLGAAIDLVDKAANGELVILIAQQVDVELGQHLTNIQKQADDAIKKHCALAKQVDDVAQLFGVAGIVDTSHLPGHVARARAIVDKLIAEGIPALGDQQITSLAFQRESVGRAPGGPGKQAMKDCVVVETYLEAAQSLRAATFAEPIVFVSSNTKDYCQASTRKLALDLRTDFGAVVMEYAPNWAAARHSLGL